MGLVIDSKRGKKVAILLYNLFPTA